MAILAGIDEAGYGPHLGPLVVAAAAVRLPDPPVPDPNLWGALRGHVRKRPRGTSSRVVVCDSKDAYTACGPAPLERATLGFLAACRSSPTNLSALLDTTRPPMPDGGAMGGPVCPWDRPAALRLPLHEAHDAVTSAADHLARGFERLGGTCERLWINVAPAARFNRLVRTTGNKAAALFALTADLLAAVRRRWPDETVHVTMDRHGGRRYYADLLAQAFPMHQVTTVEESPGLSVYDLRGTGGRPVPAEMQVTVMDRCETSSLPTALASMAAKYVRELHMHQLNAYFRARVPGLRPTAGYGRDAWRFLADVDGARRADGVPDAAILRCR
ncbi:MAG: hypothetical protein R6X20_16315 [Phycisphaerae bacterium]